MTTLTDQPVQDYRLSADKTKVCFVAGGLAETGDLLNQAFYADLGAGAVQPVPDAGLPPGDRLSPVWHPGDSSRLAVGFLPQGAMPGGVALVNLAGGPPQFLPLPQRGFDVPIAWSPDASFLAVTNYTGLGLANPGEAELDLLAPTGQRVVVATGADSSTAEAVIGWFQ